METPCFIDGLGRRFATTGPRGERLETLRLCVEIPAGPELQAAMVDRASGLADFEHPGFARVRRVERHGVAPREALALVSEAVDGVRLSDLLRESERRGAGRDLDAAMHLLEQTVASVAALHRHSPDASHGTIGPERIVLRPDGTVTLVEHVLGGVLEGLRYSRLQLWALFRVPAPASASSARFDQQTDVVQLGVLALALLLGRVLRREEFPHALPAVLDEAASPDAGRGYPGCSRAIRGWIGRALQFEPRTAFRSATEAERALNAALREDGACRPSAAAVQRFLAGCSFESLGTPSATPAAPAAVRFTRSGASVSVGAVDRGSGAQRVAAQLSPRPVAPQVVADLAAGEGASTSDDTISSSAGQPAALPPPHDAADAAAEKRRFPFSIFRFPLSRSR
jgi:hypothetical protein